MGLSFNNYSLKNAKTNLLLFKILLFDKTFI